MAPEIRVGPLLGILLLLHLIGGLVLPYVLIGAAMAPPDLVVEQAAAHAVNLRRPRQCTDARALSRRA